MTIQLDLFKKFPTLDEFVELIGAEDRAALLRDEDGEEEIGHDQDQNQS